MIIIVVIVIIIIIIIINAPEGVFADQPMLLEVDAPMKARHACMYTRSPLEDSRLFGPSPWKILALIV